MDVIVDIVFLIDILIGFLTEYTEVSTGDQIRNPAKIAKRYILGIFMFDLMSSAPFLLNLMFGTLIKQNKSFA